MYIRLILQAYLMIAISCLSQIVDFKHSGIMKKLSLSIAIIIFYININRGKDVSEVSK